MRSVGRIALAAVALSIAVDGQSPDRVIARTAYADVQPLWESLTQHERIAKASSSLNHQLPVRLR